MGAALTRRSGGGLRLSRALAALSWAVLAGDTSVTRPLAPVTDLVTERADFLTMTAAETARAGLASWLTVLSPGEIVMLETVL